MTVGMLIKWIGTKSLMDVFSNPGVIMAEIMTQRQLIFCRFDWPIILGCGSAFSEIGDLNWGRFNSSIYK